MKTAPAELRFHWRGVTRNGASRRGTLIALSPAAARIMLKHAGITPLSLEAGNHAPPPSATAREVVIFTRQLAGLLKAGLPLAPSLEILAQTPGRSGIPRIATGLAHEIIAGRHFSTALRRYPQQFSSLYQQLVAVGEASGSLTAVLTRIADDHDRLSTQRAKVRAALAYPTVVLLFALAITAALLIWIVPTFQKIFDSFGAALPAPTQFVLMLSTAVARWSGPIALFIAAASVAGSYAARHSETIRLACARITLHAPLIGPLLRALAAARWCQVLGTLLAAGTPLADAFSVLTHATGSIVFDRATASIALRLQQGERLAVAMRAAQCFPADVIQPIAVAEETGTLDTVLLDIASICDRQVDSTISTLTSLCEPLVIIVVGALVGGLVIAMYLPIVQLGNVV